VATNVEGAGSSSSSFLHEDNATPKTSIAANIIDSSAEYFFIKATWYLKLVQNSKFNFVK
jgi:hypothetical protein